MDMTMIKTLRFALALVLGAALVSCGGDEPDAHGVFEFPSVSVGAENNGKILAFYVKEGDKVVLVDHNELAQAVEGIKDVIMIKKVGDMAVPLRGSSDRIGL